MKGIIFALLCMLMIAAVSARDMVVSSTGHQSMDVTVNFNSALTEMTGIVTQGSAGVNGATFTYFCQKAWPPINNNISSYQTLTLQDGSFAYNVTEKKCDYGDNAWVVVSFNGTNYTTSNEFSITRDGSHGHSDIVDGQDLVNQVPEFSSVTLAATMIGAGLVFAFLRKR